MNGSLIPVQILMRDNAELRARLAEAENALRAIRSGEADAVQIAGAQGAQVFSLHGAERAYRTLVEGMNEGALTVTPEGIILYCNQCFARMVNVPLERVTGSLLTGWLLPAQHEEVQRLIKGGSEKTARIEIDLLRKDDEPLPAYLAASRLTANGMQVVCLVVSDLSEQHKKEKKLRDSEEKYRGLMESLRSVVATLDHDGKFLFMNEIAAESLGGTPARLIGKSMRDLFPEPIASMQLNAIHEVFENNQPQEIESLSILQGQPRWFHISLQPLHDELGRPVMVLLHATDINELKIAQQELLRLNWTLEQRVKERTAEARDLYDQAPSGYHSLDTNGNFIEINLTELNWLGYTREELLGQPITRVLTPASAQYFLEHFRTRIAQGSVQDMELQMLRKDGSSFPVTVNAIPLTGDGGRLVSTRSTVLDISLRKQVEAALLESSEQNRVLFEESPVAVVLLDPDGCIIRVNRAYETLVKMPHAELLGKQARSLALITPEIANSLRRHLTERRDHDPTSITAEYMLTLSDGSRLEVESRISPFYLDGREHILVTTIDITPYKQAEELLRFSNTEMAHAMRMKDDFLANMSHELRTPLTGILGLAESMLERVGGQLNERQVEQVKAIDTSGRHLLSLINDILDLSKIESGKADLQLAEVEVGSVCQASLAFVREPAHKKGILLEYHCEPAFFQILADARRLKQILVNLLGNAVKFTPNGGRVSLEVAGDEAEAWVRFTVTDTGIGIAPEGIRQIFQPFTQVDSSLSRNYEGTGLGLAMVKKLVELHGGEVSVESEIGVGSRFTVAIPWRQPAAAAPEPQPAELPANRQPDKLAEPGSQRRILLAEDNEINANITRDFLTFCGYEVALASTGAEALQSAGELHPDLVIMDVQMPVMDGLQAIHRLRQLPEFQHTPIIALTALAMKGDYERCIAAGANEYLSKPYSFKELASRIERLISAKTSQDRL